jgi:preprotein translocase subunit SecA
MLDSISKAITKVFGKKSDRDIKEILPLVEQVLSEQEKISSISHDELRQKTKDFQKAIQDAIADNENQIVELKEKSKDKSLKTSQKEQLYAQIDELTKQSDEIIEEKLKEILPQAFAVIRETTKRFKDNETIEVSVSDFDKNLAETKDFVEISGDKAIYSTTWEAGGNEIKWDMEHYRVQLIGGVVLHSGKIAEMKTGEGKTLVATLPVYLNALAGRGVHLVTVNDYLAKRDCDWMGPLFQFHGMSIDCIDHYQPHSEERIAAYKCDITYGTNAEFGFDYLRDNMVNSPDQLVQGKHHYAIVDEVDSVLIDDARTPLIISGPTSNPTNMEFKELRPFVEQLYSAQKTLVTKILSEAKKLLKDGNEKEGAIQLLRAFRGLPKNKALIKFLSEPGMKALLQKTENHYMQEQAKEMPVIDQELYFVIDEKSNSIELKDKGTDLISQSISDKDFFLMPDIGAVLAEIEQKGLDDKKQAQEKTKATQDYSVKVQRLHTMQQLLKAYTLFEKDVDYVVMDNAVKIVDEQTGRIMEGRRWSDGLHQAVESKENVKIEATTQTHASITLQNYFRMYHKLSGMTGTATTEAGEFWDIYKLDVVEIPTNRPVVRDDRDDKVYKTQREKFNAVIDEIAEMTSQGRPVLVGTTSVEISELLSRMLKLRKIRHNVLNAKRHQQEAQVVKEAGQIGMVTIATNMAGRGTDIKLSDEVKANGGLAIIATERHESRRVDRQLRGRAGRQGDPGSSQFFVSLEDNLMRLFGSERIAKIMDRMGLKEGEVIQSNMISKSIERAQKKVEENNFGMRKRLLEYDDVMNAQREVIYKKRKNALFGDRLSVDIINMILDALENLVLTYAPARDYEVFNTELIALFGMELPISEEEFNSSSDKALYDLLSVKVLEQYNEKRAFIAKLVFDALKNIPTNEENQFENMVVPIGDGRKGIQVGLNIKKGLDSEGMEVMHQLEKIISLSVIDQEWKGHLREMDDLRTNVQNASIEQKDPLLIYKFESFELFKAMVTRVNTEAVSFLMQANIIQTQPPKVTQQVPQASAPPASGQTNRGEVEEKEIKKQPVVAETKVGRNDPCPCGSGKKYKSCHGQA